MNYNKILERDDFWDIPGEEIAIASFYLQAPSFEEGNTHLFDNNHCEIMYQGAAFTVKAYIQKSIYFFF